MATAVLGEYSPWYFAQSIASALVSNTPKYTLDALEFQLSVWYKMYNFIEGSFALIFMGVAV